MSNFHVILLNKDHLKHIYNRNWSKSIRLVYIQFHSQQVCELERALPVSCSLSLRASRRARGVIVVLSCHGQLLTAVGDKEGQDYRGLFALWGSM